MIGKFVPLSAKKALNDFHSTSRFLFGRSRQLHLSFVNGRMKLYTDKGNLSSLKIVAACLCNNENVNIEFVSRKGIIIAV